MEQHSRREEKSAGRAIPSRGPAERSGLRRLADRTGVQRLRRRFTAARAACFAFSSARCHRHCRGTRSSRPARQRGRSLAAKFSCDSGSIKRTGGRQRRGEDGRSSRGNAPDADCRIRGRNSRFPARPGKRGRGDTPTVRESTERPRAAARAGHRGSNSAPNRVAMGCANQAWAGRRCRRAAWFRRPLVPGRRSRRSWPARSTAQQARRAAGAAPHPPAAEPDAEQIPRPCEVESPQERQQKRIRAHNQPLN
jgi:hypothetical protein